MYARKQEHSVEVLETRRQAYLSLRSRFPTMVVLDATQSADTVRRAALDALWNDPAVRARRTLSCRSSDD
jgi:thymidylate kinase